MIFIQLLQIFLILYTPEILNTNIEQPACLAGREVQKMVRSYTPQQSQFLDYFRNIDKRAIEKILAEFHFPKGTYFWQPVL